MTIPEATKQGYAVAKEGDGIYLDRPHQKRGVVQEGMIQTLKTSGDDVGVVVSANGIYTNDSERFHAGELEDLCRCIKANNHDAGIVENNLRIRKLTPKECWRLMGTNDSDFDKAASVVSNSQLYKQAGNGIVIDVIGLIIKQLVEGETRWK